MTLHFTSDLVAKLIFEVPMISPLGRCFAVGCLLALLSSLAFAQGATIKPNHALILENIPPIPASVVEKAAKYTDYRTATM